MINLTLLSHSHRNKGTGYLEIGLMPPFIDAIMLARFRLGQISNFPIKFIHNLVQFASISHFNINIYKLSITFLYETCWRKENLCSFKTWFDINISILLARGTSDSENNARF